MSDQDLIATLKTASDSVNGNIALSMLLIMAAERIDELRNDFETSSTGN